MKAVAIFSLLLSVVAVVVVFSKSETHPVPVAASTISSAAIEEAWVGTGDTMRAIAMRVTSLSYAIDHDNRDLVNYELDEIDERVVAIAKVNPVKNGHPLKPLLESMLAPALRDLRAQAKAGSTADLRASYQGMLRSCNGCHQVAGYGFIRVGEPGQPLGSIERFSDKP